jgi:gas vesicle protein
MASEDEKDEGAGFVMGLLTGTVLGAGLGMLLAPKTGSELRGQLSEGATVVGRSASEGYRKAADAATTIVGKGRDLYDRARGAVSRGAEEVKRYGNEERAGGASEPLPPTRP